MIKWLKENIQGTVTELVFSESRSLLHKRLRQWWQDNEGRVCVRKQQLLSWRDTVLQTCCSSALTRQCFYCGTDFSLYCLNSTKASRLKRGRDTGPGGHKLFIRLSPHSHAPQMIRPPGLVLWHEPEEQKSYMKTVPGLSKLSLRFWNASGYKAKTFSAACHYSVVVHQALRFEGHNAIRWPGDLQSKPARGINASKKKLQAAHWAVLQGKQQSQHDTTTNNKSSLPSMISY